MSHRIMEERQFHRINPRNLNIVDIDQLLHYVNRQDYNLGDVIILNNETPGEQDVAFLIVKGVHPVQLGEETESDFDSGDESQNDSDNDSDDGVRRITPVNNAATPIPTSGLRLANFAPRVQPDIIPNHGGKKSHKIKHHGLTKRKKSNGKKKTIRRRYKRRMTSNKK